MPGLTKSVSIPNLPGNSINPVLGQKSFARKNSFQYIKGQRIEKAPGKHGGTFVKAPRPADPRNVGSLPRSTSHDIFHNKSVPFADSIEVPTWDAMSGHVLRFYAYGKDEVTDANLENYQLKQFQILYYLVDGSVEITQPLGDNSGCGVYAAVGGQGGGLSNTYMKRGKLPELPDLSPLDLQVGQDFAFLGRVVRITNCDGFTADYYESIGFPQPMHLAGDIPETDNFKETTQLKMDALGKSAKPPRTHQKIYAEAMMNGGHINRNQQQFMEKDRMVCRFYCYSDDIKTHVFERRPFTIFYFLSDDTVQIIEQFPMNCGRAGFPTFCKRQRIPKAMETEVRGPMHSAYQEEDYYKLEDFMVGKTVRLYNTDFFVYDTDGFTRKYFEGELKNPLEPKVNPKLPEKPKTEWKIPPYNGFGSWDDSMANVVQLVPKKPRKDMAKLFFNEGKVLRVAAKFSGSVAEEDSVRRFLISYYLQDDTVMIHEPPQRNLGIVTGRFLEKGVHLNECTGKLFTPEDLKIGSEVRIMCRNFLILDQDLYTKKWFKSVEDPEAEVAAGKRSHDLNVVLSRLREGLMVQYPLVRDTFRRFDNDANGVICYHEIERALQKFGFHLSPEETLVIMKYFDRNGNGQIDYFEFSNAVFDPDWLGDEEREELKRPLEVSANELAAYADIAAQKTVERAETEKIRRAVRLMGEVFNTRANMSVRMSKELEHLSPSSKYVDWSLVRQAFLNIGHTFEPEDVQRCIKYLLPRSELTHVPYFKLIEMFKSTFHDHAWNR